MYHRPKVNVPNTFLKKQTLEIEQQRTENLIER